jgi:hypothetical protein
MYKRKNYIIPALGIEIFHKDLPSRKLWAQYNSLCLALKGDGWRAPTLTELQCMYSLHKLCVMGFSSDIYLSGDIPYNSIDNGSRYCVNFGSDTHEPLRRNIHLGYQRFRPVRSINI